MSHTFEGGTAFAVELRQPLWHLPAGTADQGSAADGTKDALFPKNLLPLELSSKPVPVPEIWGFYDHRKNGALVLDCPPCGVPYAVYPAQASGCGGTLPSSRRLRHR